MKRTKNAAHRCAENPTPHDLDNDNYVLRQTFREEIGQNEGHTDDGPPSSNGVLNVVAILEHKPYAIH